MTGRRRPDLRVFDDAAALADAGAALFIDTVRQQAAAPGRFAVALAGGSTPKSLYARLAGLAEAPDLPWPRMHFFWGDERHVPPDHPDSNARMASEALLDRVPIEPTQIHRIKAELPSPQDAAADYEAELRQFFRLAPGEWPRFDLVLLGLGADAHTASLFPGTPALAEASRLVVASRVEPPGVDRITLTAPALNHGARVVFLVAGETKADAVAAVIDGAWQPNRYPAQLIRPTGGDLIWLLDRTAASKLSPRGGSTPPVRGPSGSWRASPGR